MMMMNLLRNAILTTVGALIVVSPSSFLRAQGADEQLSWRGGASPVIGRAQGWRYAPPPPAAAAQLPVPRTMAHSKDTRDAEEAQNRPSSVGR